VAAAIVTVSLAVAACEGLVAPLPSDAEEFSPPAAYSNWWNMTEACSGKRGSLGAITWFKTDQILRDPGTGQPIVGFWTSGSNRIVLMTGVVLDGGSVRHEMLHALLRKPGHARNQFLGKCAGTVNCQGSCIRDAGPYPQPPETPIHVPSPRKKVEVDNSPALVDN